MIFDSIKNCSIYLSLHPLFKNAFDFILQDNLALLDDGKYEIDDKGSYVSVQEYLPKEIINGKIECHKKYIDVQYIIRGSELIGVINKALCLENPYDETRDFQQLSGKPEFITLKEGYFAVFFPQDGHMPGIKSDEYNDKIKKAVIKVPVIF